MSAATDAETRTSWVPMIAIALGQVLMSFNVASLPVSLAGMVASFEVPPTTIATGIVMYSLSVAGFVMLGAKLVQRFGSTNVFRIVVVLFGVAQVLMVISPVATVMLTAQLLAGLAAAVIVPALVALIANNYSGQQQATAVGALGSARAGANVAAFMIGGLLSTFIGWRPLFGILVLLSALVFFLSFRLKPEAARPEVKIDIVGVVLAASAIIMIIFGFNNLNRWGLGVAGPNAPFNILGMSPAPVMIVVGIVILQCFIVWCRRQQAAGRTPLLDLRVINAAGERAAVYALFTVVGLESMLNFSVPLYIQIVQGRSAFETSVAMLPFNLTVFFTAMLVVRLYDRISPRRIAQAGFGLCVLGLLWLAYVVRNDWSAVPVMFGLITFGIGQGALVTLLFNVLVTAAPRELAGDVGSLRGTTQNLAAGVGTALAGALLVGLLSSGILARIAANPQLPAEIHGQIDLDAINFVSNDRLQAIMARTSATPAQVDEAVRVNTEARLNALKIGFLIMAGAALLAIFPASGLPNHIPARAPAGPPSGPPSGPPPARREQEA